MNKTWFLALISAAIWLTLSCTAIASGGVEIISPSNRASLDDTFSEISFSVPSDGRATVILDGTELDDMPVSSGLNKISIPHKLAVGEHEVMIVSYTDTSAIEATNNFTIKKSVYTSIRNETFDNSFGNFTVKEDTVKIGYDADGKDVNAKAVTNIEDKYGNSAGAVGFYTDKEITTAYEDGTQYMEIAFPKWGNGVYVIEYDLKFFSAGSRFFLESHNGSSSVFIGSSPRNHKADFLNRGTIKATSDTYSAGEWIHIKHTIDTVKGTQLHELTFEDNSCVTYTTANADIKELSYLRPSVYYQKKGEGPHGFAIDNFKVGMLENYEGFNTLYYTDGNSDFSVSSDGIIKADVTKVRLKTNTPFLADGNVIDKITVLINGYEFPVSSAILSGSGALLDIAFAASLPSVGDVCVSFESGAKSADGDELNFINHFKISDIDFGIENVTFKNADNTYLLNRQLDCGDNVTVEINGIKNSSSARSAVLAAALYSGDKVVSLNLKQISTGESDSIFEHVFNIQIPDVGNDFKIECYIFDSFTSRLPLSKIWTLK